MVLSFFSANPETRLDGPRLVLRPYRKSDWRSWVAIRKTSRRFLEPWEPAWPADALSRAAYLRRYTRMTDEWLADRGYGFLLLRKKDDALMGGIAIASVRRGVAQMASLGYWIGEPYARQGYMSEAIDLIVEFGFGPLQLHRLEAACLTHNEASQGLLRKMGFTEEGLVRRYLRINGVWQDHVLFSLVAEDLFENPPLWIG